MLKLAITITGKGWGDLEVALEELQRLIGDEYTEGKNSNDSGAFYFSVTGESEADDEVPG